MMDISKILKTSSLHEIDQRMGKICGKQDVLVDLSKKIEDEVNARVGLLGLDSLDPVDIYRALLKKVGETNDAFLSFFGNSDFSSQTGCTKLFNVVFDLIGESEEFFLKEDRIKDLFRMNPPANLISFLNYKNVDEMLAGEDIYELFCSLRFVEKSEWMNDVFFAPYAKFTKDDFEKRKMRALVLSDKWRDEGDKFLQKKLHHMSHLKELGIVFLIPISQQREDEALYVFFMTLHYLCEIRWHARLFESFSHGSDFAERMVNILKVKTSEEELPLGSWRIVPGYLAKSDEEDSRLFSPHVNTESLHYVEVMKALKKFSLKYPEVDVKFWLDSDYLAGIFNDQPISFDLFDNGISFLTDKDFKERYLYHQQEALWTRLLIEYLGEDRVDELVVENREKGYIEF